MTVHEVNNNIADKAECEKQVENAEHILKTVYKYLKDKGVYE